MSVVGFDLGNYASYIAVARHGGIDVLTNDYSLHATPTCVSFGSKTRVMGVAARQQVNTNFKNTVLNFKHLLGRKFNDPVTQLYSQFVPAKLVELPEGETGFEVNFLDKKEVFTPEQVTAMLLHKLKETTEAGLGEKVNDCVISVPYYFADNQRRALLAAGKIAGLNVLRIVNENAAVGIAYGMYKGSQLPPEKEPPRIVAFVDVGHASVQASIMAFHERKVQVLGAAHDLSVGGLFFDDVIREQFAKEFQERYGLDAKSNPRAWQRLLDECEKLKKQMSANSTAIPLNIECFMNDKDVSAKMKRDDFEKLAEPLFQKVRDLLHRLIEQSGVKVQDISEVELIGGSSRIPFVRSIIAHIFNREPMTTMNQDEAVARGAAMQCAILSPSFKTKEFTIKDSFPFEIKLQYHSSAGQQEQVIFKRNDEFPAAKILTLCKKNAFDVSAYYVDPSVIPYTDAYIGNWYVECSPLDGAERTIKVKFRVNGDGVFSVANAQSVEEHELTKQEQEQEEKMETAQPADAGDANQKAEQPADKQQNTAEKAKDAKADAASPQKGQDNKEEAKNGDQKAAEEKKPKIKKVIITHNVNECVPYKVNLEKALNQEKEMEKIDLNEKRKADAKNALEEYCYNMRDRLSTDLSKWVSEEEATHFQGLLTETENWLYEDGEDVEKELYDNRLQDLRSVIETPINQRKRQEEEQLRQEAEAQRAAEEAAKAAQNPQGEAMDTSSAPPPTANA